MSKTTRSAVRVPDRHSEGWRTHLAAQKSPTGLVRAPRSCCAALVLFLRSSREAYKGQKRNASVWESTSLKGENREDEPYQSILQSLIILFELNESERGPLAGDLWWTLELGCWTRTGVSSIPFYASFSTHRRLLTHHSDPSRPQPRLPAPAASPSLPPARSRGFPLSPPQTPCRG